RFMGINHEGQVSLVTTRGNRYGHVVLRGGNGKPNYDSVSVALCERELEKAGIKPNIMIDCSHANSNKDPALQPLVMDNVANQIVDGNNSIIGLMVESHIGWGNQAINKDLSQLEYGVSITDACIDWDTTVKAVRSIPASIMHLLPPRRRGCVPLHLPAHHPGGRLPPAAAPVSPVAPDRPCSGQRKFTT